jgi:hypothetical protein
MKAGKMIVVRLAVAAAAPQPQTSAYSWASRTGCDKEEVSA